MEKFTVSVPEAAKMIGVCTKTAYALTRRADFPTIKIGTRTLVSVKGLEAWVQAQAGQKEALQ